MLILCRYMYFINTMKGNDRVTFLRGSGNLVLSKYIIYGIINLIPSHNIGSFNRFKYTSNLQIHLKKAYNIKFFAPYIPKIITKTLHWCADVENARHKILCLLYTLQTN